MTGSLGRIESEMDTAARGSGEAGTELTDLSTCRVNEVTFSFSFSFFGRPNFCSAWIADFRLT